MNNYPVWWEHTLTVYNKYEDPVTRMVTWYRTKVQNCFWKYVGEKISVGTTVIETNSTICRIPESENFLPKYEWIKLPNYDMSKFFTLGVGDIIVLGDVDDEINEGTSGHRSTDLMTKYKNLQGCIVVNNVTIDVGPGRCNPHYFVRGV